MHSFAHSQIVPAADVLLVGGGHSHIDVVRRYGMMDLKPFRLTLISDTPLASYSGMIPGVIAGHYNFEDAHIDLGHLCQRAGVRFVLSAAIGLDLKNRLLRLSASRSPLPYESLSLDIGSRPDLPTDCPVVPGFSVPIKPMQAFLLGLDELDREISQHNAERPFQVILAGGGVAGCEVALALHHRWAGHSRTFGKFRIKVIEQAPTLLPSLPAAARRTIVQSMRRAQIQFSTGTTIQRIDATGKKIFPSKGEPLTCQHIIWTTSPRGHKWLEETGLQLDARGFIDIGPTLESASHEGVYACGDTASMQNALARPKSGVFAVRQGPILFQNLCRRFRGVAPIPYRPQKHFLSLISLGKKRAVAVYGRGTLTSDWLWSVKNCIDRRFMARFQLEPLPVKVATYIESGNLSEQPCTACGSKLPADTLSELPPAPVSVPEALIGLDRREDCSVLRIDTGDASRQIQMAQSLDYIRAFSADLHLVGQITAAHCLNDVFAMGLMPHSAHALVTVPFGPKQAMRRDLAETMRGVSETLAKDAVALLGGHSQAGFQAGVGLFVQSLDKGGTIHSPWSKKELKPGDALILTKPLGSGILFAGHMRFHVSSKHLLAALQSMLKSHRDAVHLAREHGVIAATDVTGFGLANHLGEMCRLSKVRARLALRSVPAYGGVFLAIEAGVRASLHTQNRMPFAPILRGLAARALVMAESLFDPQTAGGLILGVSAAEAPKLLAKLQQQGYSKACIIGEVLPQGEDGLSVLELLA